MGWMLAIGLVVVVAVGWGLLLSPRRRVDLPLAVRVAIEVVLFAAAAVGLAWAGYAVWGWALLIGEVVVLVWLWAVGMPPGSDAGGRSVDSDGG